MNGQKVGMTSLFCETAGFAPPITGEEICAALKTVAQHLDAVIPKGRNAWEVVVRSGDVATGLEVTGLVLRGRSLELGQRFPGGTWVRVRGLPLEAGDLTVRSIFENFGEVVSGPHHVMWRGTTIKTGDRTLKVKLKREIPQSFSTLGGKTKVTVRYRDQPKTCFSCGATGHERRDCPTQEESTYARAVANVPTVEVVNTPTMAVVDPPTDVVAETPPGAVANVPCEVVDLPSDTPLTSTDSDREVERKKERRERRRKDKERLRMDTAALNKRKDVSSPETPPRNSKATHSGLPQRAPTHKLQRMIMN